MAKKISKIFIDTNVLIDVLTMRQPHYAASLALMDYALKQKITLCISADTFTTIAYLLKRHYGAKAFMQYLIQLKSTIKILPVTEKTIELAMGSQFEDFEDSVQNAAALQNNITTLISRDLKGFAKSSCTVLTPEMFLSQIDNK